MAQDGDSRERRVLGTLINCKPYEGSDLSVSFSFCSAYKVTRGQERFVEQMKEGRKGIKEGRMGEKRKEGRKGTAVYMIKERMAVS